MLKLKRLQQQKEQQQKQKEEGATPEATPHAENGENGGGQGGESPAATATTAPPGGYVLKKTNSKELLLNRKTKSKENVGVFSLRSNANRGKKEKTKAVELRVHKGKVSALSRLL